MALAFVHRRGVLSWQIGKRSVRAAEVVTSEYVMRIALLLSVIGLCRADIFDFQFLFAKRCLLSSLDYLDGRMLIWLYKSV